MEIVLVVHEESCPNQFFKVELVLSVIDQLSNVNFLVLGLLIEFIFIYIVNFTSCLIDKNHISFTQTSTLVDILHHLIGWYHQ